MNLYDDFYFDFTPFFVYTVFCRSLDRSNRQQLLLKSWVLSRHPLSINGLKEEANEGIRVRKRENLKDFPVLALRLRRGLEALVMARLKA
ncbi:hypothetical protein AKJ42_03585 [candidate division MSBL1 archaeon SCGC-AAA261C02]|uniref:Uncharacterized protein n=1 Tax=candidate division MSBL1 archaeon SCGC-AAA261C02 TaxID=1698272 RepID=A0A133UYC2_9EURY|nr:hypothetical protein AKJ42_03585 [candidate division MSBL1 archaeon SCGC-AAA261C02]